MTPVDDLRVGDWVALFRCYVRQSRRRNLWDMYTPATEDETNYDGMPWQITAISLPWINLKRGEHGINADMRVVQLKKLNRKYVASILEVSPERLKDLPKVLNHREPKPERDPRDCPRCGSRMVQVLGSRREWNYFCQDCDFDGGPVPLDDPNPSQFPGEKDGSNKAETKTRQGNKGKSRKGQAKQERQGAARQNNGVA